MKLYYKLDSMKKRMYKLRKMQLYQIFFLFESNFFPQKSKKFEKHIVLIIMKDIILRKKVPDKKDPNVPAIRR